MKRRRKKLCLLRHSSWCRTEKGKKSIKAFSFDLSRGKAETISINCVAIIFGNTLLLPRRQWHVTNGCAKNRKWYKWCIGSESSTMTEPSKSTTRMMMMLHANIMRIHRSISLVRHHSCSWFVFFFRTHFWWTCYFLSFLVPHAVWTDLQHLSSAPQTRK